MISSCFGGWSGTHHLSRHSTGVRPNNYGIVVKEIKVRKVQKVPSKKALSCVASWHASGYWKKAETPLAQDDSAEPDEHLISRPVARWAWVNNYSWYFQIFNFHSIQWIFAFFCIQVFDPFCFMQANKNSSCLQRTINTLLTGANPTISDFGARPTSVPRRKR